jgi:hypothetical protein
MKKCLFYFAAIGWVSGLAIHLLSIFNFHLLDKMPLAGILHAGIFVVWIPAIFEIRKMQQAPENANFDLKKKILHDKPAWLKVIAIASFFYAGINFAIFFLTNYGVPDIKFIQQERVVTDYEYLQYHASRLRGFSGHWLAFYSAAMIIFFPFNKPLSLISRKAHKN